MRARVVLGRWLRAAGCVAAMWRLLGAAWLVVPERARADAEVAVPLALRMPADCVSARALDALAERLHVRFEPDEDAATSVSIIARAAGYEAQLEVDGVETRRFGGQHCDQVAQAAALIVALSAQPMLVAHRVIEPDAPRRTRAGMRLQHLHVTAEPSVDAGSLPRFTGGLSAALGVRAGPWLMEALGTAFLPRSTREGPTRAASAELTLASGGLRLCHTFVLRYASLGPCLAAELGAVWARGLAVAAPREVTGIWSAGALGVLLTAHGQRFTPGIRVEALLPVRRPAFDVDGYGEVFQARRVVMRAALLMRLDVF